MQARHFRRLTKKLILLGLCCAKVAIADSLNCPCKVVDVLDGDTVYVRDQRKSDRKIWLAGIDAPELGQKYGDTSKKHLDSLALGAHVNVEFLVRDQYGRINGKLIKNGQDINLLQVYYGFAWYYVRDEKELSRQDRAIYKSAEQRAKSKGLGLWSSPSATPPWDYRSLGR